MTGFREITNYKVRVNYWKNIYRTERKAEQAGFGKGQAGTGQGLGSRDQGSEASWAGSGLFSGPGSLFTLTIAGSTAGLLSRTPEDL